MIVICTNVRQLYSLSTPQYIQLLAYAHRLGIEYDQLIQLANVQVLHERRVVFEEVTDKECVFVTDSWVQLIDAFLMNLSA
jgi:hypothetical protein